ncbi:hypothetical protein AA0X95_11030 [Bacillus sp. 1P10SD]|uniref:hypothetical protein n=1 Tax=Bacillus sp. 1P10SD TaxID=3132265 RepID=UPI0039A6822B
MYHFRMRGTIKDNDYDKDKVCEVLYNNGKLTGNKLLVQKVKSQSKIHNTGMDATAVMLLMRNICTNVEIWGEYPNIYY